MKYLLSLLALMWVTTASATSVAPMTLEQIVAQSDAAVIAKIEAVDMVDGQGRQVTDPAARTGPGSDNQIRLHLVLDEAVFTRTGPVPVRITVPLWQMWHYDLGQIQRQVGQKSIFLLKGQKYTFEPAYYNDFQRPRSEGRKIRKLVGL
ncbi:hypothetical protein [Stenotrophomonas oahuensis]|uniref:Uncharacterized protein n=1 Tax=Stenotrophomonas oahuensis TaxID=3003271 RepID=A0ABY9YKX9_9GAMM|nr:hypothetical protein [Stenotrophomonas sp. A5586]WNH51271.1 hypothetical protein PDM29_12950 [Stenotrophomonas sp. A5586]